MDYAILYSESYLAHHGILGQKWGVRRFQNSDGSYTAAGKDRYGRSRKQADLKQDPRYKSALQSANKQGVVGEANKAVKATKDINDASTNIEKMAYKYKAKRMSDEKLQEEIDKMVAKQEATADRRALENRYKELKNQEVNTGREVVRDILDVAGNVTTGLTAAATLYLLARQILNG